MTILPDHVLKLMSPKDRPKGTAGQLRVEIEAKAVVKSEKALQQLCEQWLRLQEVVVIRQRMDKKSNVTLGCPDLLFVWKGKPMALECKLEGKKAEPHQLKTMEQMHGNGWIVGIVRSLQDLQDHVGFTKNI